MEWPRLFLASDAADDPAGPLAPPSEPSFVLDTFVHVTLGAEASEVLTGLDDMGNLSLHSLDGRDEHLSSIRAHLAHAEVAAPERRRVESAREGLWLFALELVEQLPDAPGANDPIYLYGTLWPAADVTLPGVRGQLASTRADVLRGLVDGARWAFRFPPDEGERVPRGFHLMLPGDRADALATGRGVVLAYPAIDPGLMSGHAGNELPVMQILHDLLRALRDDADRQAPRGGDPEPLPVPDLAAHLRDLEAAGWEIDKNDGVARRRDDDRGFLKSLFGGKSSVRLPSQATIDDYLALAERELARLPAWPTSASQALFARVGPWTGAIARARAPAPGRVPTTPRAPEPPTAPPAPAPKPPPAAAPRARRDEWMQDFVNQHAARQPQLTRVARPAPPGTTPPRAAPTTAPTAARPGGKPDWMKDFE